MIYQIPSISASHITRSDYLMLCNVKAGYFEPLVWVNRHHSVDAGIFLTIGEYDLVSLEKRGYSCSLHQLYQWASPHGYNFIFIDIYKGEVIDGLSTHEWEL